MDTASFVLGQWQGESFTGAPCEHMLPKYQPHQDEEPNNRSIETSVGGGLHKGSERLKVCFYGLESPYIQQRLGTLKSIQADDGAVHGCVWA